ncbi:putative helicase [Megavirus lba]|uniref:Putative helicase n=1 Tax=Megavirus lba TaxID=1235314 RepID=L7Y4J2_9VIRU|nr:putative helicase [Megavirus lba]
MHFFELNEESPKIKQPKGFQKVKLKDHQLTSIAAMLELEQQKTVVIDKPEYNSNFYHAVKYRITDLEEFCGSTFILETDSAILSDGVGSGKTYMIIGLLLKSPIPKSHDKIVLGTDNFSIKMIEQKESVRVNLIVLPHNLVNQWDTFTSKSALRCLKLNTVSDFNIFFDIDRVSNVTINPDGLLVLYTKIKNTKRTVKTKNANSGSKCVKTPAPEPVYERKTLNLKKIQDALEYYDVFLLNVERYKHFKLIFKSVKWARVIIDEMDTCKVPATFDEFGNFNWFLTATPTSIFGKSCRRYVNKIFGHYQHLLNYFEVKNKQEYVQKSMVLPKPNVFFINTMLKKVISVFQDLIPQDVLNLIHAGNMKEAITKLNCNIDTEENIIEVLTEKIKTELHNLEKEMDYVNSLIPADMDAHENRVNNIQKNIDSCKIRLESINEKIKSIKNECCFICTEPFDTPAILECCKSTFCLKCLATTLKTGGSKCPYCRKPIKSSKDYHIISTKCKKIEAKPKKISMDPFNKMDKADVLEHVLKYISKNDDSPKILIFSDYSQTFEKIIKNISKADLQYSLLSGVPAHITNVINEFEAGITNVLMLDSQHYGSGLNLQSANYIILYHRMTPELEIQVIGRAQRFGRKTPLKIIYLINDSERKDSTLQCKLNPIEDKDELWKIINPIDDDDDNDSDNDNNSDNDSDSDNDNDSDNDTESKSKSSKKNIKSKKDESTKKSNKNLNQNIDSESDSDIDGLLDELVVVKRSQKNYKSSKSKKPSESKKSTKLSKTKKSDKLKNNKQNKKYA